jgi:AIG2-like family
LPAPAGSACYSAVPLVGPVWLSTRIWFLMRYFAYGSNMDREQMEDRCPEAQFVAIGLLPEHRLAFTRNSAKRRCGVADAVPAKDHGVWGVIYNILGFERLDSLEGYRHGRETNAYWRRECEVLLDGELARRDLVASYFAERQPNPPLPSQSYKDLILSGARHWQLPDDYVKLLEQIEVGG